MLVVAERINSTRKRILPAVESRDVEFIQDEARKQAEAGANYIDCNASAVGVNAEPDALVWTVETVQAAVDLPCALDSPSPDAIEAALKVHRGTPMINSITAESDKLESLLPIVAEHKAAVVALCMGDEGIAAGAEDRLEAGRVVIGALLDAGVEPDLIYADPLVFPIGTDSNAGLAVLELIVGLKKEFEGINTICGLSNVSFGLPLRKLVNQAFMVLTMGAGLDGVIVDPLDEKLMSLVYATDALLGNDEFCMEYIKASRAEKLVA